MGQPAYYNHCDNLSAVYIINKGGTAHPLIMHALRLLFWLSAIYNFRFTAVYVQGHLNTIADAMSRLHEPLLRALKHRIAPMGLVISGFVSIWVTLPSQPIFPSLSVCRLFSSQSQNTIADAMSRLHEPRKCVAFYHHLQQVQPCQLPDSTPLTQQMSLRSYNFLFSRIQGSPTGTATSRRNLSVPLSHLCLGH